MQTIPECLKPTGPDTYQCSRSGFVVKTSALRIRCQCPGAIVQPPPKREGDDPPPIETVEQRIWRWMKRLEPLTTIQRTAIAVRLHHCLNDCGHVVGGVCDDWPRECKRWEIWMNRLAFGSCRKWPPPNPTSGSD